MAADCAINGIYSALGGALLGAVGAGLMISSMGVLSTAGWGPVQVDSDMNSSHTFTISNANSSYLKCSMLVCMDYSNFSGCKKQINNISNTNLKGASGSDTRCYASTLQ